MHDSLTNYRLLSVALQGQLRHHRAYCEYFGAPVASLHSVNMATMDAAYTDNRQLIAFHRAAAAWTHHVRLEIFAELEPDEHVRGRRSDGGPGAERVGIS